MEALRARLEASLEALTDRAEALAAGRGTGSDRT
jgi:hypothetical protein